MKIMSATFISCMVKVIYNRFFIVDKCDHFLNIQQIEEKFLHLNNDRCEQTTVIGCYGNV